MTTGPTIFTLQNYVGGLWVDSQAGEFLDVENPGTGETLARVPLSDRTELDQTVLHADWTGIIDRVRDVYEGPLTYAANWDRYQTIPFWEKLDAIGIQAYFPIVDAAPFKAEDLAAGWRQRMTEVAAFSKRLARPALFTELGYNRLFSAPIRPWEGGDDGPTAEAIQAMAMQVALAAIGEEPSVLGAFLWKWFPEPRPLGKDFQLATPAMSRVVKKAWTHRIPLDEHRTAAP
jgi:hypothetical protein